MEFDKNTAGQMLGRRISGIVLKRRKPGVEKVVNWCWIDGDMV